MDERPNIKDKVKYKKRFEIVPRKLFVKGQPLTVNVRKLIEQQVRQDY